MSATSAFFLIEFSEVIAFHETGLINQKVTKADIGQLAHTYREYASSRGFKVNEVFQIILIAEAPKSELVVVCRDFRKIDLN